MTFDSALKVSMLVLTKSSIQFAAIFGLLIGGGALLTLLSRLTNNVFRQFAYPTFGMYFFGWIGVPVHEFCHAFFCRLFLHDVKEVKWFDAEGKSGAHGFVVHEYHQWNVYQRVGQFFIGLGPVLLGPIILATLFYFLVPMGRSLFTPSAVSWHAVSEFGVILAQALVNKNTLTTWQFYLFLYLTVSITSQMELSGADIKQALTGAVPLFLVFTAINFVAFAVGANWHAHAISFGFWVMAIGVGIFALAAFLTLLNLALCLFIMTFLNRCLGREGINPFEM